MSKTRVIAIGVIVIFIVLQLIPINQTNPPIIQTAEMPDDVEAIMRESCFDCHSNETRWPWYSRIAPGSFLITYDVMEGREHLNFSEFAGMDAFDSSDVADEIIEVLENGEMPVAPYLILHPSASLSDSETEILINWAKTLHP